MDVCVCCGNYVPEGSQVCWSCINKYASKSRGSIQEWAVTLAVSALNQGAKGEKSCQKMR